MRPMEVQITEPVQELEEWQHAEAHRLTVSVSKDEGDRDFTAIALNLPGASGCGETQDEAIASLKESVLGLIKAYAAHGHPVPWEPLDGAAFAGQQGSVQKVISLDV